MARDGEQGERFEAIPERTTLLALVQRLDGSGLAEDAVVSLALWLVRTGRVTLTGSFAGASL
jgi:hypothetical protein